MSRLTRGILVPLALVSLAAPAPRAAAAEAAAPPVMDVALAEGGVLHGSVIDARGEGVAGARLSLRQRGEVASIVTGDDGRFAVEGLRGGTYQVVSERGVVVYRLWAPGTAPPSAHARAMILDEPVVRGQLGGGNWAPWVLGGVTTAAIAVPILIAENQGSSSS